MRSELFRILLRECLQTSCKDTLGQSFFRTFFIVITIVDEEVGVCGEVWHVTLECIVRVYRYGDIPQVQPQIGIERTGDIGMFVVLLLRGGETNLPEGPEGGIAVPVDPLNRIGIELTAELFKQIYILLFYHYY